MSSESVFAAGDVVLANPKEAASLLSVVILLAVGAQYLFRALRRSKTASIRMVFNSFSNSLLTIGAISLVFSFAAQAVGGINERWLLLLRWSQVVLLTLLLHLFAGTIIGQALLRKLWTLFDETEGRVPSTSYSMAVSSQSTIERSFVDKYTAILHIIFVKDVAGQVQNLVKAAQEASMGRRRLSSRRDGLRRKLGAMLLAAKELDEREDRVRGETSRPDGSRDVGDDMGGGVGGVRGAGSLEEQLLLQAQEKPATKPLLLSTILQHTLHTQMSDLADITWQSWLCLIFLVGANSVRMFALPGKLQSKPVTEFTVDDRTLNVLSFIGLVGWLPTVVWLVCLGIFVKNFKSYMEMADSVLTLNKDENVMEAALARDRDSKSLIPSGAVWVPPSAESYHRNRNNNNNGDDDDVDDDEYEDEKQAYQLEDPVMYFLRAERGFTLTALRVPMLMVELYSSMFFIGMIGDVASTFGPRLVYVIPVALLPVIIVWLSVPIAAFMLAVLSSLGSALSEEHLATAFLSPGEWREVVDEMALHAQVNTDYAKDGQDAGAVTKCANCDDRIDVIERLQDRVQRLEELCRRFGLKADQYKGKAKTHSHHHHHHRPAGGGGNGGGGAAAATGWHMSDAGTTEVSDGGDDEVDSDDVAMEMRILGAGKSSSSQHLLRGESSGVFSPNSRAAAAAPFGGGGGGASSSSAANRKKDEETGIAPITVQAAAYQDQLVRQKAREVADQRRAAAFTNAALSSPQQQQQQQGRRSSLATTPQETPRTGRMMGATPGSQSLQQQQSRNSNQHQLPQLLSPSALGQQASVSTFAAQNSGVFSPSASAAGFGGGRPMDSARSRPSAAASGQTPRTPPAGQNQQVRGVNGGDAMMRNVGNALRHL